MADLKIGRMVLGVCQTNCYFVYREGSSKVIFIDPADYGEQIFKAMKDNGFEVAAILLTHGHFDHIWGCSRLRQLTSAPVYAYEGEEKVLLSADLNVSADAGRACTVKANTLLKDGEEVTVEGMTFKLIATPGHTQGSCCYYFEEANMLISGDTLFEESVGRTDLPTGSMSTLVRSVKDKLFVLPDDTVVYPGHGDSTTIGHEKKYNPFI
jgi:glyoxylase-like metal-dependent hydrolase (beta-lactamase superfamily II)